MKLALSIIGSMKKDMEQELSCLEKAVMSGVKKAGEGLKLELRSQVMGAGLSQKLANTWRLQFYENKKVDAASLVYSKAPEVISSFDKGVVIKSGSGIWLAIPTANAPKKGIGGKRINPTNFPTDRLGNLRFVYRKGRENSSSQKPQVNVKVNVNNNASNSQATASYSRESNGDLSLDVMIEQVEKNLSRNISKGSGLAPTLENRYGLNPARGSYG